MATFISITTSPFEEARAAARVRDRHPVRRPLRGIQIKEDTYAVIRVKKANGEDIPLLDSGSSTYGDDEIGRSALNSNFLLQAVSEQRAEKQQIVETFGEDYVFFFGERPRFLRFQGMLLNTANFQWKAEFLENYERHLRGTRLVEQNARAYIYFDDVVVEGYVMETAVEWNTQSLYMANFNFTLFVTNYAHLSNVGSVFPQFFESESAEDIAALPTEEAREAKTREQLRPTTTAGLGAFLADQAAYQNVADFSIRRTLETIRNTFYGRQIVIPNGLGNQLTVPPITNQAEFSAPASRGRQPYFKNADEYIGREEDVEVEFDKKELSRVQEELRLRSPEELERRARLELERLGVDVTRRETNYLLLGRGAFAATQYMASFGMRRADGQLGQAFRTTGFQFP
jgi:hypothetical protein